MTDTQYEEGRMFGGIVASMVRDFLGKAREARKDGLEFVLVPGLFDPASFNLAMKNPAYLGLTTSNGGEEPVYLNLDQGLNGRNKDGSNHKGFLILHIGEEKPVVVDNIDREGNSFVLPFKDGCSYVGFIGKYPSARAVQYRDTLELQQIGSTFEQIAGRMQQMADFALKQEDERTYIPEDKWSKVIVPITDYYNAKYGENWNKNSVAWDAYRKQWAALKATFPQTHMDEKVAVINYLGTRGFQVCPFEPCQKVWSENVSVVSRKTGRELTINRGTIHFARDHHFIEKGNEYGITPKEFYESFM